MEIGYARLTLFFEDPFWVGVYERECGGRLEACKLTFGAEPKDCEVYERLLRCWQTLEFSPGIPVEERKKIRKNAKRMHRTAGEELRRTGVGTKAQQALKLQQEQHTRKRRQDSRARDEEAAERRFMLRQSKRKEKHRGH